MLKEPLWLALVMLVVALRRSRRHSASSISGDTSPARFA
jgi:hypothetical protein